MREDGEWLPYARVAEEGYTFMHVTFPRLIKILDVVHCLFLSLKLSKTLTAVQEERKRQVGVTHAPRTWKVLICTYLETDTGEWIPSAQDLCLWPSSANCAGSTPVISKFFLYDWMRLYSIPLFRKPSSITQRPWASPSTTDKSASTVLRNANLQQIYLPKDIFLLLIAEHLNIKDVLVLSLVLSLLIKRRRPPTVQIVHIRSVSNSIAYVEKLFPRLRSAHL